SWTENEGRFSAPFYGQLMRLQSLLDSYAVTTSDGRTYRAASARFATGPRTGEAVSGATVIDMNPNLYTDMKDMGRLGNDLALSRRFAIGRAKVVARAGWYYSRQKIAMDWHWNQSIKTALTDPARIDLFAADGTRLTDAGLTGYNNQWGACCARTYDLTYTDHAPYLLLNYIDDRLDISGSVRRDEIRARGTFRGTAPGPVALDVNGDGQLSVAERNVYRTSSAVTQRIAYDVGYTSWTLGANYLVTTDLAVFVRVSHGYRANADRVVSGDYGTLLMADGGLAPGGRRAVVNPVTQQGIGLKARGDFAGGRFGVNATLFRAQATEFNYDLTRAEGERITFQRYKADGFELEAQFAKGGFSLHGNLTHTHSKIARDLIGGNRGNRPRATPAWTWSVAPAYDFGVLALGMTMVGHSSSYPSDDNRLRQRGQNLFSAFVRVEPVEGLELSLNANNLFNAWDQSGRLDQGSVADLAETGALFGVPYAATNRVGLGRTVSGSVKYSF
ncbi:MAG: TonB-dependent receptor, partial [Novosphingobium sp.]